MPFLPPSDLPNPGIKPPSPALAGRFLPTEPPGKPVIRAEGGVWPLCTFLAHLAGVFSFHSLPSSENALRGRLGSAPASGTWVASPSGPSPHSSLMRASLRAQLSSWGLPGGYLGATLLFQDPLSTWGLWNIHPELALA